MVFGVVFLNNNQLICLFFPSSPSSKKGPFIQFNLEMIPLLSMEMEDSSFSKVLDISWLINTSLCSSLLNVAWSPDTFNVNGRFARGSQKHQLLKEFSHRFCWYCCTVLVWNTLVLTTALWWRNSAVIACILEFQLLLFLSPTRMWNPCCPMDLHLTCPLQHTWWLPPLGKW